MPQPIDFMRMIQQIRRRYAESLRPLERRWTLTGNEIDVLLFLANNPGYDTARDAVEMRGLSKSHVCKSVDALTRRGWLAGEQDKRDRRCVHLRLLPPRRPGGGGVPPRPADVSRHALRRRHRR